MRTPELDKLRGLVLGKIHTLSSFCHASGFFPTDDHNFVFMLSGFKTEHEQKVFIYWHRSHERSPIYKISKDGILGLHGQTEFTEEQLNTVLSLLDKLIVIIQNYNEVNRSKYQHQLDNPEVPEGFRS